MSALPLPDLRRRALLHALGASLLAACQRPPSSMEEPYTGAPPSAASPAPPPSPPPAGASAAPSPGGELAAASTGRWAGLEAEVDAMVREALERGEAPGAVVGVMQGPDTLLRKAYGRRSVLPQVEPMTPDTVFDLASLTKPIATAMVVHLLHHERRLALRAPLGQVLVELAGAPLGVATVEQLLLHTAGLEADVPAGADREGITSVLRWLRERPLRAEPGEASRYSDTGYQLLAEIARRAGGASVAEQFARRLAGPLGARTLTFHLPPELRERAAPTVERGGRWLRGEAHDPRVATLGAAAGHAGLFGAIDDLLAYLRLLLDGGERDGQRVVPASVVAALLAHRKVPAGTRTLGWDVSSGMLSSRGDVFPARGVGHLGYTGTSVWLDPPTRTAVVVLTSRLHPDGKGNPQGLRRAVATAVGRRALGRVRCGLEVLAADPRALVGQRVALLTHAAAVDGRGRRGVEVLREAGLDLVALFTPEHGLDGRLDRAIRDGRDERSGLPVHSLYGDRRRPTAEQLRGLDHLLIDLQDAGCRFYTYLTTLGYTLEEAARAGVAVTILDRPNPLGGLATEGPLLDPDRASFVAYHPVPLRHGLTLAEAGRLIAAERSLGVVPGVVAMDGWKREMRWRETGLPWRDPSPNLRSPEAALLYPGVGLLELTNLSVGRGTDRPFERLGAPWLDEVALGRALPSVAGVRVAPTRFVPTAGPFAGQTCRGLSLTVTDPAVLSPVRLGLDLACALRQQPDWELRKLAPLLGHRTTLDALARGDAAAAIAARWQEDLGAYQARRAPHLLYA